MVVFMTSCQKDSSVSTTSQSGDENVTAPGELPIVKEKITLNIGMPDITEVIDFETNAYTKWLEEQTGVDLEFTLFPANASEARTKLDVMLASGTELPEVLMHFDLPDSVFLKNASSGVFVDLSDYMDKYGYWFKKMLDETINPNMEKLLVSANGKRYFMPYVVEQTGNFWPGKAWINKKWLDVLGLDVPKTTEEFATVLRAFKNGDPNQNGIADEIPLSGSKNGYQQIVHHFLMNSFIYCDQNNYYIVENGKLDVAFNKEEWRNGLRYMSGLFKEGLIDIQCFVQDSNSLKTLALNPDVNILGCFPAQGPDMLLSMPERMAEYVALPPLVGPEGKAYSFYRAPRADSYGIITKYCKNPLAAFRLMDFMLCEESALRARYGVPGVDWEEAKETDKCMFESIGAKPVVRSILPYAGTQNSHWQSMHPVFRSAAVSNGMVWNGDPLDVEYIKASALPLYMNKAPKETVSKLLLTEEEIDEMTPLETSIKNYVKESSVMFIVSEKDLDADWNAYLAVLDKMGLKRFIELSQSGYDRFNNQ